MHDIQTEPFACRHIFPDGHRCQSPTLRGASGPEPFCYYHHNSRQPVPIRELQKRRARCRSFRLNTADLNHRSGIQQAIAEVLREIAANTLDTKRAGLLLYGLQTAILNLPKESSRPSVETQTVQEVVNHPDHGLIANENTIEEDRVKGSAEIMLERFSRQLRESEVLETVDLEARAFPEGPTPTPNASRLCTINRGGGYTSPIMRKAGPLLFATLLLTAPLRAQTDPVSRVNPLIGTQRSAIGYGATMPFVTAPFGMTSWTAQTRQNKISVTSYHYDDTTISGFIGTHQPAIWMGDYGYVTLMPQIGELRTKPEDRKLPFQHAAEAAHPDHYKVSLDAGNGRTIAAAMTASERCGLLRFTFPAGTLARIIVEASRPGIPGFAAYNPATHEIAGFNPHRMDAHLGPLALPNFKGYFVVQFDHVPLAAHTYGMETDAARGAYAEFTPGQTVEVRVGTSFLSLEQARANIQHEIPTWDFGAAQQKLRSQWNDKLSRLRVTGANDAEQTRLYTALYHALLYPREFSEYGRYYSAFDDTIHNGRSYTAYSIWDTFRAEWSLLTLMAPERIDGMVTALLQNYKEGGWMPKWPNPSYTNIMIGTHADSLVAEAVRKGFHGFDRNLAWQAVYKDAMQPPDDDLKHRWLDREEHTPYEARGGLTWYKQLGYIPTDKTDESASRTLEDSYDDWCVAQIAKALGRTKDYNFFLKRSLNDRNLYNPTLGLMNGRTSDGKWAPIGGPKDTRENRAVSGWTEGDAWVYTFSPFHDQAGLLQLMGGAEAYTAKLDQHFSGGHNVHKNEPSHHYGYLYDFAGQPWKTQARVREVAAREYDSTPGGLDGDDDCGQMSAWLLFTAMGFYPVNPAGGDYMIGSPLYGSMSLRLANGKTFTVQATNNSAANVYIQSATLDGKPLAVPFITWEQIQSGATLHFVMGPQPSSWASAWRPQLIAAQ